MTHERPPDIARAVALLRAGELVGLPTETVYGLAADARNPAAVARIFAAKGRPADHPLIVHLPGADHLPRWARDIPPQAHALAQACWPGPLTLILPRQPGVPDCITGGQDTVGLRVPAHPVALALLTAFDGGLAAPSANRFGRISPTCAADVHEELGEQVALVLDGGPCAVGIESTIVDLSDIAGQGVRILRPGALSPAAIAAVIGHPTTVPGAASRLPAPVPRVSGSLAAHYAPRTPLCLLSTGPLHARLAEAEAAGLKLAVLARSPCPPRHGPHTLWQAAANEPAPYAHDLYAHLRCFDRLGLDLILVEALPTGAAWAAITDRLQRAATGSGAGPG